MNDTAPTIICPDGRITGTTDGSLARFWSIPYCEIPGPFDNPVRQNPNSHRIVDATQKKQGTVVLSIAVRRSVLQELKQSAVPADLPVIAFIHGGRYEYGHPDRSWYTDGRFAADGCVYVSIGYRMRFEGFLPFDGDEPNHYRGSDDVIEALEWIQRNIESFGGDPTNVTLMGQSAGAGLALWCARKDHYRGAFRRVVALSPGFPRQPYFYRRKFLSLLSLGPVERKRFASLSEKKLKKLYRRFASRYFTDAAVGPSPFDARELVDIPILVSETRDEFYPEKTATKLDRMGLGPLSVRIKARELGIDGNPDEYLRHCKGIDPKAVARRAVGDSVIRQFSAAVAEYAPTEDKWLVELTGTRDCPAVHCAELPLLFDCLSTKEKRVTEVLGAHAAARLQKLADTFHGAIVDFAKGQNLPWKRYDPRGSRTALSISIVDGSKDLITDPLLQVRKTFPALGAQFF